MIPFKSNRRSDFHTATVYQRNQLIKKKLSPRSLRPLRAPFYLVDSSQLNHKTHFLSILKSNLCAFQRSLSCRNFGFTKTWPEKCNGYWKVEYWQNIWKIWIKTWQKNNVLLMGKDESGWDFVLISNPSSTYKKLKSLWFVAFDRRRGQIL